MKDIIFKILKFLTHRLFILLVFIAVLFYVLILRLFDLQIIQGRELEQKFNLSVLKEIEIESQRGNIYDRNGYPLAENIIGYNVYLNDSIDTDDKNGVVGLLAGIIEKNGDSIVQEFPLENLGNGQVEYRDLNDSEIEKFKKDAFGYFSWATLDDEEMAMTAEDVYSYLRDSLFEIDTESYSDDEIYDIVSIRFAQWIKRYSKYQPDLVAVNINESTLAELEENRDRIVGLSIVESPFRIYHDAEYFAHIIGYIGKIDSETLTEWESLGYDKEDVVGKTGIEEVMEFSLQGTDGSQSVEVNSLGKTMAVLDTVDPVAGEDVFLTLDRDLQVEIYDQLEQHLADVLVEKLRLTGASDGNKDYTLLKDVFISLIETERLKAPVAEDEANGLKTYEAALYNRYFTRYQKTLAQVEGHMLENENLVSGETTSTYMKYIWNELKDEGKLDRYFRSNEGYSQYLTGKISFEELLDIYVEAESFVFYGQSFETKEEEKEFVISYITDRYLDSYEFQKMIYTELIDEDALSLVDLSLLAGKQGVVTTDEEEMAAVASGRLKPLDFIKSKIASRDLTPQEVALDPSAASVVVTDVKTGEVRALVSYPSYDNNRLVNDFANKDYSYYYSLLNDPTKPLYPRATQSRTAPGSTFKMVSATAALEEGVVGINEKYMTLGTYTKIWPPAKCWIVAYGSVHGLINIKEAIMDSCNYFFYEMGYRLSQLEDGTRDDNKGIAILQEYAGRFGLDSKTGLEIPESESTLADNDSSRAAIGQGATTFTPVQIARYINTLANDGELRELNLVDKVMDKEGVVVEERTPALLRDNNFNQKNLDAVKEGMYLVTHGPNGSGTSTFGKYPVVIAGKTGTAQENPNRPEHALFASYAPYDDPEVSVIVVLQFSHSSSYAVKMAEKVYTTYYGFSREKASYSSGYILE